MTGGRVVVFGDVIDDVIARPLGPVRLDTDTPATIRSSSGGSASNTAAWLGSLGAPVDFVGAVGRADVDRHSAALARHGVVPRLAGHDTLPTGTIVIVVDGQTRTMLTERGANSALHAEQVTDALLDAAVVLHLTGYSVVDAPDPAALCELFKRAEARGVAISVDPGSAGYIADHGADRFLNAIEGATALFPSLEEARALTGESDSDAMLRVLGERFPIVALTRGAEGVLVAADDAIRSVAAVEASVLDPTGAGDAFCAGFLHQWLESGNPFASADAGVRLAAEAVAVNGGRPPV